MKVAFLASEMYPLAKVGGLADVAGALPKALRRTGVDVSVFMPFWSKKIDTKRFLVEFTGAEIEVPISGKPVKGRILKTDVDGVAVYLVQNEEYYGREELYGTSLGDYPDNAQRFAFFVQAVLEAIPKIDFEPDLFHVNDWEAALLPVYIRETHYKVRFGGRKTLLTIHNLAYQGLFEREVLREINLPESLFHMEALEFYGRVNFLKGGIVFSDKINTVSPTYANEIMEPEYGCGLEGVLKKRGKDLCGILNGIDYEVWDPSRDERLFVRYSKEDFRKKRWRNKVKLQELVGLPVDSKKFLMGVVSRLAEQKGIDILAEALEDLVREDIQAVILGTGDKKYEDMLRDLAKRFPEKIAVRIDFDPILANRIYGGVDVFLMPSRFEPCGLGQMIAMRYGAVPLVRMTGGLRDTVKRYDPVECPDGYGFAFVEPRPDELKKEVLRAMGVFKNRKVWNSLIERGMSLDFSWDRSANRYFKLYRELLSA